MRVYFLSVLTVLVACDGCSEDGSSSSEEGPQGSVAHAAELTMRPVTEDGYEVIEATPAARRRLQKRRAEARYNRDELVLEPTSPDPHNGSFTLEEAVEGLGTDGTLIAEINTTFGSILCDLYAEETPNTVANFIGLARGKRQWWDARAGQWRTRPYYRGTRFHRVVPEYLIQGGDYLNGDDGPVGYTIADEPNPERVHDRPGQLCMASTAVNENGAQFFITDGRAPQLDEDSRYTIFGQCRNRDMIYQIARVPQDDGEPTTPVVITNVRVRRVRGGAAQAKISPPRMPEGFDPETSPFVASPGPSEQNLVGRPDPNDVFDPSMRPRPAPMQ